MTDIAAIDRPLDTFDEQAAPATRVRGYWRSVLYRLRHDPVTLFFAAIVLLIVLAAIFAPLIAPFDPYKESIVGRLKPFGWRDHLLGTDELGRDMLSRLIYGGRVSLLMGVVPVLIASIDRRPARRRRRLCRRPDQHRDHAHDGRILRLPLGAAGGRDRRGDGRRHRQRHAGADPRVHPADVPRRGNRDDAGPHARLYRGGARQRRRHRHGHPLPRARQRAGAGVHLRLVAGQRQHPAGLRPVVSRPGRAAADRRLGADAEHVAAIDLCRADRLRAAGRGDLRRPRSRSIWSATGCARRWTCGCSGWRSPRSTIRETAAARPSRC